LKLPVVKEFKRKIEQAWEARGGRKRSLYAEATEMRKILEECAPDSDAYDEVAQSIRERVEEIRRDHMEREEEVHTEDGLMDTGVGVTILMPGVTDTNFFNRAEMLDTKAGAMEGKDDPAVVAKAAFEALQAGKDKVVPTVKNKVMSAVAEALPEPLVAAAHRAFSKPGSAN
jgi:hypothetical protein